MIGYFNKLRRLFDRRDKLLFLLLFFLMIVGMLVEVLGVGIIPVFITLLTDPDKIRRIDGVTALLTALKIETPRDIIIWGSLALLLVFALRNGYLAFLSYAKVRFVQGRFVRLVRRVFMAYMQAPYNFYLQRNSAELLRNIQQETQNVVMAVLQPGLEALLQALFAVGIAVLLLVAYPMPALLTIGSLCLFGGLFVWLLQGRAKQFGLQAQKCRREFILNIQQGLGSIKEARVLQREFVFLNRLSAVTERLARSLKFQSVLLQIIPHLAEFIGVLTLIAILFYLIAQGEQTGTIGPIVALFAAAFFRLKRCVSVLMFSAMQLKYTMVSIDPVYNDLVALRERPWEDPGLIEREIVSPLPLRHEIVVRNLSYRYSPDREYVLSDINLTIPKGASVALVGPTGAGKTTLVDVLLGLLLPEKGEVRVDDVNMAGHVRAWQANIGYVPQSIYLLDDTIKNNIVLGLPARMIDDSRVRKSIQSAQLESFIEQLPRKEMTVVGENGVRLSGGQRQRIGIARALYHEPEVVVLDEATSSLDTPTEQKIMADVHRLKGERTIIIIAHRLSTVRECDTLFFLENGRVAGQGTYDELMKNNDAFREFALAPPA